MSIEALALKQAEKALVQSIDAIINLAKNVVKDRFTK